MDTTTLEKIGLSKKEAKVYLSLLKLKLAPVTKISEESGVDRTQTYDILQNLIEKGLASYILKNNTRNFSPSNPDQILQDIQEKEKEFKLILPSLTQVFEKITFVFSKQFLKQVEEQGIKEKIIFNSKETFTKLKTGEYRYLSQDIFNPTDALIYEDHVVFFIWAEPYYAIVIKSKEMEKTYRKYFDFLWKL